MTRHLIFLLAAACLGASATTCADPLVTAAKSQIGVTLRYDPAYRALQYPSGDVPMDRGVCTDVLIRAYRQLGFDLQRLVHEDMTRAWAAYPKTWRMRAPDPNIDHRRVPNLAVFFQRHGETIAISRDAKSYRPGDIVTWSLRTGVPHIGVVSNERAADGTPFIIHNIGEGVRSENILFAYTVTGHYRWGSAAKAR